MKLLQVTDHHLNSGIGRYSFELSKALLELGHEVQLSKPYKKKADDQAFDIKYTWIHKIHYKSFRSLHPYLLPYFVGAQVAFKKADIYHGHWFMAGLGLLHAKKSPLVITMHDVSLLHEKEKEGRYFEYYKNAINQFSRKNIPIIVVSERARQDTLKYSKLADDQVFAVHNGISFDQFFPKKKEPNPVFQITYAGGLSPRKNLDLLLKACQLLESKKINFHLRIAGNYPERTPYPKLVADMKLKNVTFVGFIDDNEMCDFYNSSDVFVYTSTYEGFGFAPLEAMACGIPVISTTGGALAEVSGGGAHLISYDPAELADTLLYYMDNSEKRNLLAEKGRQWVQKYSWENCAKNTVEVYKTRVL